MRSLMLVASVALHLAAAWGLARGERPRARASSPVEMEVHERPPPPPAAAPPVPWSPPRTRPA